MTEVTRVFDTENRRFLNVQRKYSGQQYDSLSTTLHFEYDPIDFLSSTGYTPFIMFDVQDCDGCPMIYGPLSTPRFDGYTFSIPWDVTSRIKSQRIEYQLYFVSNDYYVYDEAQRRYVESGTGTKYLLSPKDGIAIKPSIAAKKKCGCPPLMAPTTEPSIVGYINTWREKGLIGPVGTSLDPVTGLYTLSFQTFSGETYDVQLAVDTSGIGTLRADLEATMTVGGVPKGYVFKKGTSYEDIFRMLLSSKTPAEELIARYGAVTTIPPRSYDGLTVDPNATWEILTSKKGWLVHIVSGTTVDGEQAGQYPAVAVNKSLEMVGWYDTDQTTNYWDMGYVKYVDIDSEPTPGPSPLPGPTRTYSIENIDKDHTITGEFGVNTSTSLIYTMKDITADHTITAEFTEQSGGDGEGYRIYYMTKPQRDTEFGGNDFILKFRVI